MAIRHLKLAIAQTGLLAILAFSTAAADPVHGSSACALGAKPVGTLLWDKTGGNEQFAVYLSLTPFHLASESVKPETCATDRATGSSEPRVTEAPAAREDAKPRGAPWAAYVLGRLGN